MRLSNLITTLENSIAKYGYTNYAHHQNELLPSLIKQISTMPREAFGSYQIPSHAEENYKNKETKPIVWTHIYQDADHSYGISMFRLFSGGKMPLHDHPDISGINYLLKGSVDAQSYDIIDVINVDKQEFIGIKYPPKKYKENEAIITLPNKDNIHEFTATENTAILQILLPEFDHKQRICSYWKVMDNLSNDKKNTALVDLQKNQTVKMENISMDNIVGLKIIPEPRDKVDVDVPFDGILE